MMWKVCTSFATKRTGSAPLITRSKWKLAEADGKAPCNAPAGRDNFCPCGAGPNKWTSSSLPPPAPSAEASASAAPPMFAAAPPSACPPLSKMLRCTAVNVALGTCNRCKASIRKKVSATRRRPRLGAPGVVLPPRPTLRRGSAAPFAATDAPPLRVDVSGDGQTSSRDRSLLSNKCRVSKRCAGRRKTPMAMPFNNGRT
mmetsp:Transcript_17545/g.48120  ORF Transcript_17545/g.48120 Transcript_17545/m.48120 type:complete len:200 (-) Transcript_17545:2029-2628(-)